MSVSRRSIELAEKQCVSHAQTSETRVRKYRRHPHSLEANELQKKTRSTVVIHRTIRPPKRTHPINSKLNDSNDNLLSVR